MANEFAVSATVPTLVAAMVAPIINAAMPPIVADARAIANERLVIAIPHLIIKLVATSRWHHRFSDDEADMCVSLIITRCLDANIGSAYD